MSTPQRSASSNEGTEDLERAFCFAKHASWTRECSGKSDHAIVDLLVDLGATIPPLGKLVVGVRTLSFASDAFVLLGPLACELKERSVGRTVFNWTTPMTGEQVDAEIRASIENGAQYRESIWKKRPQERKRE